MQDSITVHPIAVVKNTRDETADDFWGSVTSEIELLPHIPEGALEGIEDFSHLEIIFHFHKADKNDYDYGPMHPRENPAWKKTGIYAMRKKSRPNHIGLTTVKLVKREGRVLTVELLDADNGTPVLDIKPVIKEFLPQEEIKQPQWATELMQNYWKK